MQPAGVKEASQDVNKPRQPPATFIVLKEETLTPGQSTGPKGPKINLQTAQQNAPQKASQNAPQKQLKVPPPTAPKTGKTSSNVDLSRTTSEVRQKLLRVDNSHSSLVGSSVSQRPSKEDQASIQSEKESAVSLRVSQTTIRSTKVKKRPCPCYGRKSPQASVDNDAKHIASINTGQTRVSKYSSSALACCKSKPPPSPSPKPFVAPKRSCVSNLPCVRCVKKFLAFLFSHIGLCAIVIAYCIMGGFLFRWLEASDEIEERISVSRKRNNSVSKLWNVTNELNILYEKNWTIEAEIILRDFQDEIVAAVRQRGWDGKDEYHEEVKWSFSGSLLYSITVITTIGYGHIAPKTDYGRLATMLYALLGIPLCLLCLSNIGSSFAKCFRFFYKYFSQFMSCICCPLNYARKRNSQSQPPPKSTGCLGFFSSKRATRPNTTATNISLVEQGNIEGNGPNGDKKEPVRVPMYVSLIIIGGYIFGGAVLFSLWEKEWNYLIGAYFCFVTLSTIGFGDYVFGVGTDLDNSEKLITCAVYLVLGLSIIAMCFNLMQEEVKLKFRGLGIKLGIIEDKTNLIPRNSNQ